MPSLLLLAHLLVTTDAPSGIKDAPVPFFIKPITRGIAGRVDALFLTENFKTHFSFLESQLASSPDGGEYLCGAELTAVRGNPFALVRRMC